MKKAMGSLSVLTVSATPVILALSCSCSSKLEDTKAISIIDAKLLGWNNKTSVELIESFTTNQALKNEILKRKSLFFVGELSKIQNVNSFEVEILPFNNNQIKIIINLLPGTWYKNGKLQKTNGLKETILITNFKEGEKLNINGGKIDNLVIDKYSSLIEYLQINERTQLSSLTDEIINNKLQQSEKFKKVQVKILPESNTKEGILTLSISGSYNNQWIKPSQINIKGFNKYDNLNELKIKEIEFNLTEWFDNSLPIDETVWKGQYEITNIHSVDWNKKYIANFSLYDSKTNAFLGKKSDLSNLELEWSATIENKKIKFKIKEAKYKNFIYKSGFWIKEDEIAFNINKVQVEDKPLLTKEDVYKYLLETATINLEELKKHYPSYFKTRKNLLNNRISWNLLDNNIVDNKRLHNVRSKYFTAVGSTLSFLIDSIETNDFENKLSFSLGLFSSNRKVTDEKATFSFENKTKNINNLDLINNETINNVSFKDGSYTKWNLIKKLKTIESIKEKIDEFFEKNNNESELETIEPDDTLNKSDLFNSRFTFDEQNWININNDSDWKYEFDLKVFNEPLRFNNFEPSGLNNSWNTTNKIYWIKNETGFLINEIKYTFDFPIKYKIEKGKNNSINVSFAGKTRVVFDNDKTIDYKTNFNIEITKYDWNKSSDWAIVNWIRSFGKKIK